MSVLEFVSGDKFIFRSKKYHSSNPAKPYYNTYEAEAIGAGDLGDLDGVAEAIGAFERALASNLITFDKVDIATWNADSTPYNPNNFAVVSLNQQPGLRNSAANLEPLEMCLFLERAVASGRQGKLFLRGSLYEDEVHSPAGDPVLSSPATIGTLVADAVSDSALSDYLASTFAPVRLAMVSATGANVRALTNIGVKGVRNVNMNHRWFTKQPQGGGE